MKPKYANEYEGQYDFFAEFGIDPTEAVSLNNDGVHRGNLLEFKTHIADVNAVLFQAIKYLSKLRVNGRNVPSNILLVDLNAGTIYKFDSADYADEWNRVYTSAASRDNKGFQAKSEPVVIRDYLSAGAQKVRTLLDQANFEPVRITEDCVVAWAERFYREVHGSNKTTFLNNDPRKGPLGELKDPRHFAGLIHPYEGDSYAEFSHILDRLNDKLKKIELGAFYTPTQYVEKSHELLREAIARVPDGNDYVIIDRCAGTGNLERGLTEEELSHCIVNTYEQFEYLELAREFGDRVRAVIPPTYKAGDPKYGLLLNGDALSDRFVLGLVGSDGERVPNVIQDYLDDETCTVILFENPPYADVAGMVAQRSTGRNAFGWSTSYVRQQMDAEWGGSRDGRNNRAVRELTNLFIWSAFRYYLRQPTDSYVVYSPTKYFKMQSLVQKRFVRGFLFNRKHFHATKDAGISVILWANEDEPTRADYPLAMFDVDRQGALIPGATKSGFEPNAGNVATGPDGVPVVTVRPTTTFFSTLYDARTFPDDVLGAVMCETNGTETSRSSVVTPVYNDNIVGYLVTKGASFDQTDMNTQLTRCTAYNGMGFHLRADNYIPKLPLFAAGRYPSEGRFWIRGVVNRCADNGDNFSHDQEFLKACLIFTALAFHNKCLSFTGSDGKRYQNELCLDEGSLASKDLTQYALTASDKALLEQWQTVLRYAKATEEYDPSRTYGTYQINRELNVFRHEVVGRDTVRVAKYPLLNGSIKTLVKMTMDYHHDQIAPKLWEYGLLK